MPSEFVVWECGCGWSVEAIPEGKVVCMQCFKQMVRQLDTKALLLQLRERRHVREAHEDNVFERAGKRARGEQQ